VCLFVSALFGPASFDSGVLPFGSHPKSRTAPTYLPHSPQPIATPSALRISPQPRTARDPQANIASPIPNHNTSHHVFSRALCRCTLVKAIEAYDVHSPFSLATFSILQSPLTSFLAYHRHLIVLSKIIVAFLSLFPTLSSCTWLPKGLRVTYSQTETLSLELNVGCSYIIQCVNCSLGKSSGFAFTSLL
jgi:hypothetical protein